MPTPSACSARMRGPTAAPGWRCSCPVRRRWWPWPPTAATRWPRCSCAMPPASSKARCPAWLPYRLQVRWADGHDSLLDDPYRFGPVLGEMDAWLLAEGSHLRPFEILGAMPRTHEGVAGCSFAVWAPNAMRVSVVGDFNFWDGRRHPMRLRRECGVWEIFLPGVDIGARYKFELLSRDGQLLPQKVDPYARQAELRPATASVVAPLPPLRAAVAAAPARQRAGRADQHLRGAPGLVAAQGRRRQPLAELGRTGRRAGALRRVDGLHAPGTAAGHRVPLRRLLGLPDAGPVRADRALRRAGRLRALRRARACRRPGRAARLGAGALPHRRARPGALRRHAAVRIRRPARRLPQRLEHADLQLRPHRGAELPGRQRAVLAGALRRRRPARRRGGLDAVPRLQPQARRMAAQRVRRAREPGGHRLPQARQRGRRRAAAAGGDAGRRIDRLPRRCRARPMPAGWASTTSGTWAGCTTRCSTCRATRRTASTTTAR